jgi:hypothetical protein
MDPRKTRQTQRGPVRTREQVRVAVFALVLHRHAGPISFSLSLSHTNTHTHTRTHTPTKRSVRTHTCSATLTCHSTLILSLNKEWKNEVGPSYRVERVLIGLLLSSRNDCMYVIIFSLCLVFLLSQNISGCI